MKKHGILNSKIAKVLADLGHTDQIAIGDAGLPIPAGVHKIDLALALGEPAFIRVLEEVMKDMEIEKVILAEEIHTGNPQQLKAISKLTKDTETAFVSHEAFKQLTKEAKVIIRTGEATPYSNIILQSNVIF